MYGSGLDIIHIVRHVIMTFLVIMRVNT